MSSMWTIPAAILLSTVFIWLVLKAIGELYSTRSKEREFAVKRLELEMKSQQEDRLMKEAEAQLDLSMHNKETIEELRQELAERDRIIEKLREELKITTGSGQAPADEFDAADDQPGTAAQAWRE